MGSEQEYLGFLAKQNWQIGQNYIPCVQRYSFRIKIFCSKKKQNFGSILRLWERIFRSLFATFGHGCQTRILRVQRPYWNKSGIGFIFNFSKFWRKLWFALKNSRFVKQDLTLQENNFLGKTKFSTNTALREEWTVVCRNMTGSFAANALHATIEAIWRKRLFFSHRNINFEYLFWLWTENVQNFLNFFAKGVKTELYVSRRTFWKKNVSARSYIFISFQGFAENILNWRKTPWSSRRHFTWPVEYYEEEFLGETKNSWVVWNERKISVFWRNSFSRVVKTAFRVSRETLWGKCTFSRKKHDFESIFWHWVKNFLFWL